MPPASRTHARHHRLAPWFRAPLAADLVFPRWKLAVFVDGCFWHGCPLHATWPKQNARFWRDKIRSNQRRDRAVNRILRRAGWRVLRIWEHALTKRRAVRTMARLARGLRNPTYLSKQVDHKKASHGSAATKLQPR